MKKAIIFFIVLFLTTFTAFAQSDVQKVIVRVMNDQEQAWNNYDLSSFMKGYWQNDSLQFITGRGITYGWASMLQHYIQAYPDKESMGTLAFSELQIRELSSVYCFVSGKWQISRKNGVIGGFFTLLFKKINKDWRIIIDHTD